MKRRPSSGSLFLLSCLGLLLTLSAVTALLFARTGDSLLLLLGGLLTGGALVWLLVLALLLRHSVTAFTADLCHTLDDMLCHRHRPANAPNEETLFAHLSSRLLRLYEAMERGRNQVEEDRQVLQCMVSDISHQVKTPVSNLKMLADTLLTRQLSPAEQRPFLLDVLSQTEKLDFLFGAMVKSSRLETGLISLNQTPARIYDTLAQALAGIVYQAEEKGLSVTVDCPEALLACHDSKWTAEALFNLLDNAVKYTPTGGRIAVAVAQWELYVKIAISDTGCGIPEGAQAAVFHRFHRQEEVHTIPGVGLGLHLAREIITRQGGYIRLLSAPGQGSTFSVFLPGR